MARSTVMGGHKAWTLDEALDVLRELDDAASAVFSELAGEPQTNRANRKLFDLQEPMRKAACVFANRAYLPPVDEQE